MGSSGEETHIPVVMHGRRGSVVGEAVTVHGPFAVVPMAGKWRLVHVPTGYGAMANSRFETRGEAEEKLRFLRTLPVDWWITDPDRLADLVVTAAPADFGRVRR